MKTAATSSFTYFLFLNYITGQNRKHNGQLISADHIAKDHIHTDITCNTEEPQQKYRLATVSNILHFKGGGLNAFLTGSKPSPSASTVIQNVWFA